MLNPLRKFPPSFYYHMKHMSTIFTARSIEELCLISYEAMLDNKRNSPYRLIMEDIRGFLEKRYEYFNILSPREQTILRAHYGFEEPPKTLKEIGKMYEVTSSAIQVVEQRAIQKLKKNTV